MPRRTRTSLRDRTGRGFSPELESFLAGDGAAFSDDQLLRELGAERYFVNVEDQLRDVEKDRYALLQEKHAERRAASQLEHFRRQAAKGGFLPQWQAYVDAGEDPAFAFTFAQQRACEASLPEPPPQARPN